MEEAERDYEIIQEDEIQHGDETDEEERVEETDEEERIEETDEEIEPVAQSRRTDNTASHYESRLTTCSLLLIMTILIGAIAILILYLCDDYSIQWLKYFNSIHKNIKVPM
jgi:hypothetical protein